MIRFHVERLVVAAICLGGATAHARTSASVTVGGYLESEGGRSYALDGRFSPSEQWTFGAGVGHGESDLEGAGFSGTSVNASAELFLGGFFARVAGERWKDSGQVRSDVLRGELGWIGSSGISFSALVTDRALRVHYSVVVLGETRERDIDFEGTGFGFDLSYYGESWNAGARFVDYDYGNSVARVRNAIGSADTQRFPAFNRLVWSIATRAAGAPERELSFTLGRQFARSSVALDWQLQRDAIFREDTHSLGLTFGREFGPRVLLDLTAGFTDGETFGAIPWGGLALTLRSARP